MNAQGELLHLLLRRLKACAIESLSYRSVFQSFTDEGRGRAEDLLEEYRRSDDIRKTMEAQFQGLDSLVQQVSAGIQEEEGRKLLEQWNPSGEPN